MNQIQDFLCLPPDTPQKIIQERLVLIHKETDLETVMDCLFEWELKAGYITKQKLEDNVRLSFFDESLNINFRLQVNVARSNYSPVPADRKNLPKLHCLICKENLGRPGKENLRIYEYPIDRKKRMFFLQLTPFPLFSHHFVLIQSMPRPQLINHESISDLFYFLEDAPNYTLCANSDVEWAGSSILEHLHYQIFKGLETPVMEAGIKPGYDLTLKSCNINLLNYPIAVIKIRGREAQPVKTIGSAITEIWKSWDPGKNTVNLSLHRINSLYHFYIFLRNPAFRTPERLRRIKSEGVGIIEASGEGIYPVPTGPDAEELWNEIRGNGLNVIKDIIDGNNPVKENELWKIMKIYEELETKIKQGLV
ncbi:MAG: DUF4922 domain-containing protein [bacterium]